MMHPDNPDSDNKKSLLALTLPPLINPAFI